MTAVPTAHASGGGHALVTGGSARVGRAIAVALARSGLDVTVTWSRAEPLAHETVALCRSASGRGGAQRHSALHLDLTSSDSVRAAGEALCSRGVDVLVHNASVYSPAPLASLDEAHLERNLRVHVSGPLMLTRALAPGLAESRLPGGGAVVCMTDMHLEGRPYPSHAAYFASKGALAALVPALAVELAPRIRVNAVAPGVVAWPDGADPAMRARYESRIPLGRPGTPDEAAECVRWLALDAHYVTGVSLRVDGGRWLR